MMTEIIKELTAIKRTNEITSDHVLNWAERENVQRVQKAILDTTKESLEFDMIRKSKKKEL